MPVGMPIRSSVVNDILSVTRTLKNVKANWSLHLLVIYSSSPTHSVASTTMAVSTDVPVFTICGVKIQLGSDETDSVNIIHAIPKGYDKLSKQRSETESCDFTIIIGDNKLFVHKAVLRARIPFFRALFDSNTAECDKGEINLSSELCEFDSATLECLLNYAYTGLLTISVTNVQNLMMGAIYFNMEFVIDECARFMKNRITVDNAIPLLAFSQSVAYKKMNEFIFRFTYKNFVPISHSPAFFELDFVDALSLLRRTSLHVDEEKQVFDAISGWITHDSDRKKHSARLLKCVRCAHLPNDFIADVVEKTEWVKDNAGCIALVNEAKEYIRCKEKRDKLGSFRTSERSCDEAHRLVVSICTMRDKTTDTRYCNSHVYDPITDTWTKCVVPVSPLYTVIVSDGHKIYFFGSKEQKVVDITTNECFPIPKLIEDPTTRFYSASGVIKGRIYVAGGGLYITSVASAACYNPSTEEWSSLAPMAKRRSRPASCVYNGKLYVIGGCSDTEFWHDGECYDPETDIWTPISPMKTKRRSATAVLLKGQIYVAGGYDGSDILNDVERYDPVSDTWTAVKSMQTKRQADTCILEVEKRYRRLFIHTLSRLLDGGRAKAVVSSGKMFIFGGYDCLTAPTILTSVEMYHPEIDSWEFRQPIPESDAEIICVGAIPIPASIAVPPTDLEAPFSSSHSSGFRCLLSNEELLRAVAEAGIKHPSRIQHCLIPKAVRGMDLNCQERSGTGKTSLFIMATLDRLEPVDGGVSVIVLCPSRDLADHIGNEFERFSKYLTSVKVAIFTGDQSTKKNRGVLKNSCPHVVIGTPGRILALVQSGSLSLSKIKQIVVDDCDRMMSILDMRRDVDKIFKIAPREKQVLLFSTNLSIEVKNFAKNHIC